MADTTQEDLLATSHERMSHQAQQTSRMPKSILEDAGVAVFQGTDAKSEVAAAINAGLQDRESLTKSDVIRPNVDAKGGKAKVVAIESPYRLPNFTMGRAASCTWKIRLYCKL